MSFEEPRLDNFISAYLFDGSDYVKIWDWKRLTGQIQRIFELMCDEHWRTLREISVLTGAPESSVSAQLRHLRKKHFGKHTVNKRRKGDPTRGLFEYQVIVNYSYFRWSKQQLLKA